MLTPIKFKKSVCQFFALDLSPKHQVHTGAAIISYFYRSKKPDHLLITPIFIQTVLCDML